MIMRKLFAFLVLAAACRAPHDVTHALRPAIEVTGRPAVQWSLAERMAHYHAPAVSIAIADGGRIVDARAFGEGVNASTPFQAASISKVIAATATLRLVEQGKLDLDTDVNRYLRSWRVPDSDQVTLRRILTHRAGFNVHGFMGYKPGTATPTILQVLDGKPPAQNQPIRVTIPPDTKTLYSGGGITVEQLVLTDVTGKTFPELVQELVLDPLNMRDSTYATPAHPAKGYDGDGHLIDGGWRMGPEMAAGWLWTTPSDLLRWAIGIDEARDGKAHAILAKKTATEMLTSQHDLYGLGPILEGSGRAFRFGHGGNNAGYLAQLVYFPETNQGAAIMVNNGKADVLIDEILRAIAVEYHWPAFVPERVTAVPFDATKIAGAYDLRLPGGSEPIASRIASANGRITFSAPPMIENDEIIAVSNTELVSPLWGYHIRLTEKGFTATYGDSVLTGTRR